MDRPFSLVMTPVLASLAAVALVPRAASAQDVPSFAEVVGHRFGERITEHHQMARYLEVVAEASDRVSLLEQGESWEGRRLLAAVVTSAENHARLAEIRETNARLADPRALTGAEARELMADHPVILWYGGSIHGNELSGSEGLLKLFQRLTTADDEATLEVLRNAVVIVDPMLNPDGRDAFARKNRESLGREPNPDRDDWNNDFTGWQGIKYRTGHYHFDTNRDWFAHTQRETRARVETITRWHPHVSVDAHEMGPAAEFYFDPAAPPYPGLFPEYARQGFERFNAAYATAFDSAGFEYMTRERYNYFYPGYTTSYSSYQGSVGMLYEQGTSAGLALRRPDGSVRTLAEALEHHYLAAWTAAATSARQRSDVLRDWHAGLRRAVADGRRGVRRYLVEPGADAGLEAEAVRLLIRNGIEVHRLQEQVTLEGVRDRAGRQIGSRRFPAGTWVVEAAQPRNRLLRVLMEPDVPVPQDFLAEARERVEQDRSPRFYDITSWSVPLLFDLRGFSARDGRQLPLRPVTNAGAVRSARLPEREARYAYLLDGRNAATVSVLDRLARRGHRVSMLLDSTRIEGRSHPSGTGVALVGQNDATLHADVRELARRFGVDARGVDTGLGEGDDPSLGTGSLVPLRRGGRKVGLLAEMPVHGYSFGWTWHALDRQYEIPVTILRTRSLSGRALGDLDVLIVPDLFSRSALAERVGEEGMERIRSWVREGGTLVAVGEGVEFARRDLGLLSLRSWYDAHSAEGEGQGRGERTGESSGEGPAASEPQRFRVPGAVFSARVDESWWLAAGVDPELPFLVTSSRVLLPPAGPPDSDQRVVARVADAGDALLSGHAWSESVVRLAGAVLVYEERAGAGRVVAFGEDPGFRGYFRGADRLFLNAVVFGPQAP